MGLRERERERESKGVEYFQSDATNLENIADSSIESLSALCSVEHFGLGRYGDKIDPQGWESALLAFQRVLKRGGRLYFSVPVGKINKVCFNAHRVFKPEIIIETLNLCDLAEFSYIPADKFDAILCAWRENGALKWDKNALSLIPDFQNNGITGLFEFVKR